jgi:hypothetical protein
MEAIVVRDLCKVSSGNETWLLGDIEYLLLSGLAVNQVHGLYIRRLVMHILRSCHRLLLVGIDERTDFFDSFFSLLLRSLGFLLLNSVYWISLLLKRVSLLLKLELRGNIDNMLGSVNNNSSRFLDLFKSMVSFDGYTHLVE